MVAIALLLLSQSAVDWVDRARASLDALERVRFEHRLELDYASQGYHHEIEASGYLEFDATVPHGFRYRFEDGEAVHVYNGSEQFIYDGEADTLDVTPRPPESALSARYLIGSLASMRQALRLIPAERFELIEAEDDGIVLQFVLHQQALDLTGRPSPISKPIDVTYRVTLDPATALPIEVIKQDPNGDRMRSTLKAIDPKAAAIPKSDWYFSSLATDSTRPSDAPTASLIEIGQSLPGELAGSGRPRLLQFFISHCGPSIDSVAPMNRLFDRFATRGIDFLAINPWDSAEIVDRYRANNAPRYPLRRQGAELADELGISGYPTVVVADGAGRVTYAGGMDEAAIGRALEALLD